MSLKRGGTLKLFAKILKLVVDLKREKSLQVEERNDSQEAEKNCAGCVIGCVEQVHC